ncbi:SPOSA6832_03259 [Sporobolomyces salmonicolor]|uniref:SPOSA6832_03259-mRNA-1:cds n=1 Tax=Sporidiobolus salmonicolor TaxID=5005 RepID=A0A0D6ENR1_SPOSA|nr:SPOSA6832_03259 [Sporobolomyces salmonicolor]
MAASKETSNTTIYIGGFSPSTTAASLHAAFLPFGEILDLQLPPDPTHQQRHRGFAFVSYSTAESALDAIDNMHRNCLPGPSERGRVLKVNRAKPQKGVQLGGSNKPIWADEAWLKEHGVAPVGGEQAPIAPAGGADAIES